MTCRYPNYAAPGLWGRAFVRADGSRNCTGERAMASITELEQELALANRRLTEIHAQIGRQRRLVHRLERAGEIRPRLRACCT